jgi:hypothetical protein
MMTMMVIMINCYQRLHMININTIHCADIPIWLTLSNVNTYGDEHYNVLMNNWNGYRKDMITADDNHWFGASPSDAFIMVFTSNRGTHFPDAALDTGMR